MTVALMPSLASLAASINAAHTAAERAVLSALEHARRAGDMLIQAKAQLPHGSWLPWLKENCPALAVQRGRTAQKYMRIAERWPEIEAANAYSGTTLGINEALALLAEPRELAMPSASGAPRSVLRTVPIDEVVADDGWRYDDSETTEKLVESVRRHGQVLPLVARQLPDGRFAVVSGRGRLRAFRDAGCTEVLIADAGAIGEDEALRLALALDMGHETNFARLGRAVAGLLDAGASAEELAACSPFTAERIKYFGVLAKWDWSIFERAPSESVAERDLPAADLETYRCPECAHEWSGHPRPALMPRNVVFYRGPSQLTGEPIVAIAGRSSENPKTGPVVQVWIVVADMDPIAAVRSGKDRAICGDCKLRGDGTGRGRACYVQYQREATNIYRFLHRAEELSPERLAARIRGQRLRITAYGDATALPLDVWRPLLAAAAGWTGYTHQWRTCDPAYRDFLMASVESIDEYHEARAAGWRTYRIRAPHEELTDGEIVCPASSEAGHRTTCDRCNLCDGGARVAKSPAVLVHGAHVRFFRSRREAESEGTPASAALEAWPLTTRSSATVYLE